jgi:hypothetical protein
MPGAARTVCQHEGCPNPATRGGRCAQHQLNQRGQRLNGWDGQRQRQKTIAQRGEHCEVCGAGPPIELHHVNGNPSDNTPTNLMLVCPAHHERGGLTHHWRRPRPDPT